VPAIEQMISEGRNINVTLIFSLDRHEEIIEAYLGGLEDALAAGATDLSAIRSVASFFVSRVDTEVDRRLTELADGGAPGLAGKAAVAQAKLAYQLFRERFSGSRWEALAAKGARVQRPLWASTSTKNPAYPDLVYVDDLIGPDTVNTMPESTVDAFMDHGVVARTVDRAIDGAHGVMENLAKVGIDMEDVAQTLEDEGVTSFSKSFDDLVEILKQKAANLARRQ
ncbi:MAG: transaldolase family protein, partial [Candidatus Dormibacteria bacterium]